MLFRYIVKTVQKIFSSVLIRIEMDKSLFVTRPVDFFTNKNIIMKIIDKEMFNILNKILILKYKFPFSLSLASVKYSSNQTLSS